MCVDYMMLDCSRSIYLPSYIFKVDIIQCTTNKHTSNYSISIYMVKEAHTLHYMVCIHDFRSNSVLTAKVYTNIWKFEGRQ